MGKELTLRIVGGKGGFWWLIVTGATPPQVGVISPLDVKIEGLKLP